MGRERIDDFPTEEDIRLFNAIENALAFMHKKVSPQERMDFLRSRYCSPIYFIESHSYSLKRIGIPRLDAFYFSMIPQYARMYAISSFGKRPRLNKVSLMAEYLKSLFVGVHLECFYVIMLDRLGYLKKAVLIRKGTVDSAPFYLKEALTATVRKEARAVVLCHNHPRGTLRPSREDIACTLRALNAYTALGVPMLDHIIIAKNKAISMRDVGAVPSKLWDAQKANCKLLREWIDVDLLQIIEEERERKRKGL